MLDTRFEEIRAELARSHTLYSQTIQAVTNMGREQRTLVTFLNMPTDPALKLSPQLRVAFFKVERCSGKLRREWDMIAD